MSTLFHTGRHVWLAQSPLTEATHRVLRWVPAEPGELFGSAALDTLDCTAETDKPRWRLASLHKRPPVSRSGSRTFPSAPQFQHRPPTFGRVNMTVIKDSAKAQALAQELSTLLDNGAITPMDALL
ncbi:hypothetical protein ABVT39_020156 [Epinephelus coioides]